ncbi:hypothetical protein ACO0LC_09055 [Undibacterium sp. JH2W]|uniref:hypothetical protein n=1 Tax=Undibacterium sp. JH2W TaxID=3413037 RepID=UPI003BF44B88
MPYQKSLFTLFILFTLAACQPGQKSAETQALQDAFPAFSKANLAEVENYSVLSATDDWKLLAWSSKPGISVNKKNMAGIASTFSVYKKDKQAWRLVLQQQFVDSYNPRLQVHTEFTLADKPVVVLKMQQGAAYEQMLVYGMVGGEYKLVQTIVAAAFEWTYEADGNKKYLLALSVDSGSNASVTASRYQWNGQQFMLIDAVDQLTKNNDYAVD